jgi:hypothetical protein
MGNFGNIGDFRPIKEISDQIQRDFDHSWIRKEGAMFPVTVVGSIPIDNQSMTA